MISLQFNGDISLNTFLDEYWQKKPLLLRQAIDPAHLVFAAEELAGIACEEGVESRLIQQHQNGEWTLQHGPLEDADFADLPEQDWTLLVQDMDKHVDDVAAMLDAFRFLPDWRIDDIMISYAADKGGVGPHTDNYDVFLIQAQGERRWRISDKSYTDEDLLQDCPLRILKHFETSEDWTLQPGDVLYLPPRVAHWGTAVGACMTWSLGLRGANQVELADSWLQFLEEQGSARYFADNLNSQRQTASEIQAEEFAAAAALLNDLASPDNPMFKRWFAAFVTEPKPDFEIQAPEQAVTAEQLHQAVIDGTQIQHHPWARFATLESQGQWELCVQSQGMILSAEHQPHIDALLKQRTLDPAYLLSQADDNHLWDLLAEMYNRGWLIDV